MYVRAAMQGTVIDGTLRWSENTPVDELDRAETWAVLSAECNLRYEEFDLDDDHTVWAVYTRTGELSRWGWLEYLPLPVEKKWRVQTYSIEIGQT